MHDISYNFCNNVQFIRNDFFLRQANRDCFVRKFHVTMVCPKYGSEQRLITKNKQKGLNILYFTAIRKADVHHTMGKPQFQIDSCIGSRYRY